MKKFQKGDKVRIIATRQTGTVRLASKRGKVVVTLDHKTEEGYATVSIVHENQLEFFNAEPNQEWKNIWEDNSD